jgi:hypothetical protein
MNHPKTVSYLISLFDEYQLTVLKGNFDTQIGYIKLRDYMSQVLDLAYREDEVIAVSLFLSELGGIIYNNRHITRLNFRMPSLYYYGYIDDTNLLNE